MKISLILTALVAARSAAAACSNILTLSNFANGGSLTLNPMGFESGDGSSLTRFERSMDGKAVDMVGRAGGYWYSALRNGDNQCMDLRNFNSVRLVVRAMTLDSFKIFIKNGNGGSDCSISKSEAYANVAKSDFQRDARTGFFTAEIPFSAFDAPVSTNSGFAMGLVELAPTGNPISVVSIDFGYCTKNTDGNGGGGGGVKTNSNTTRPNFDGFVRRDGSVLKVNGRPLRFVSFNAPGLLRKETEEQEDLIKTIANFANGGSAVTRSYIVGSIGKGNLIESANRYNEGLLRKVDKVLQLANQHKVKVILPLIDRWSWHGGIPEFNKLYGNNDDLDAFFTNRTLIEGFKNFIRVIVTRVNTVTGRAYRDDPAILAWETGNELMTKGFALPPVAWTREISNYIKSLDTNHLVMDGGYSTKGRIWSNENLQLPNVDIYSQHYYSSENQNDYAARCVDGKQRVQSFKKSFLVGEYGLARADHMKNMIDTCFADILDGTGGYATSSLAGAMIWSLQGRKKTGGFFTHGEGYGYYAYHYPGFPGNENLEIGQDESVMVDFLASRANALRLVTLANGAATPDSRTAGPYVISPLDAPKLVSIAITSDRKVVFNWYGSIGATVYRLYGSLDNVNWYRLLNGRDLSEFTDSWVTDNDVTLDCGCATTIYYKLIGRNEYTGVASKPLVFEVSPRISSANINCSWQLGGQKRNICEKTRTATLIPAKPTSPSNNGEITSTRTVKVTVTSCASY